MYSKCKVGSASKVTDTPYCFNRMKAWSGMLLCTWTDTRQLMKFLSKILTSKEWKRTLCAKGHLWNPQLASNLALNTKLFSLGHEPNMLFFNWGFSEVLLRAIIKEGSKKTTDWKWRIKWSPHEDCDVYTAKSTAWSIH